jgi:hypothetical protein
MVYPPRGSATDWLHRIKTGFLGARLSESALGGKDHVDRELEQLIQRQGIEL